jgi:hypothetical protein
MKKMITTFILAVTAIAGYAQTSRYSFHQEGAQFGSLDENDPAITSYDATDDMVLKVKIGFSFKFNGQFYDSVGISENGFIWFGSAQPDDIKNTQISPLSSLLPASVKGVVSAMGIDLHPHTNTQLTSKILMGSTDPGRQFTIEWRNTSRIDAMQAGAEDTLTFEINLYKEEFNRIDILYYPNPGFGLNTAISTQNELQVGIKGANISDFTNRMTDATHAWNNNTLPGVDINSTCRLTNDTNPSMSIWNAMVWYDDQTVGVAENYVSSTMKVYPVPVKDVIYIDIAEADKASLQYELYDLQGRALSKGDAPDKMIAVHELKQGIYFVKVFSGNKVYRSKVIKD